jgi:hypothetical protein
LFRYWLSAWYSLLAGVVGIRARRAIPAPRDQPALKARRGSRVFQARKAKPAHRGRKGHKGLQEKKGQRATKAMPERPVFVLFKATGR